MKVFLFPMGPVILYPGTSKPIQFFEPRYLKMLQDSLEQNVPIALGFVDDWQGLQTPSVGKNLTGVREIVGYGQPHVLESKPDGTVLVLLPGQGKARLGAVTDISQPYLVCEAEPIQESLVVSEVQSQSYLVLQKLLLSWLQNNIHDSRARDEFRRHLRSPQQIVGCVANYLVADPDLQQLVLEVDRMDEKIKILSGIIGMGQSEAS